MIRAVPAGTVILLLGIVWALVAPRPMTVAVMLRDTRASDEILADMGDPRLICEEQALEAKEPATRAP